jgi:ERCC4-related helicase
MDMIEYLRQKEIPRTSKLLVEACDICEELGSFCGETFLKLAVIEGLRKYSTSATSNLYNNSNVHASESQYIQHELEELSIEARDIYARLWAAIVEYESNNFIAPLESSISLAHKELSIPEFNLQLVKWPTSTSSNISSKLRTLLEVLKLSSKDPSFCGIIFVNKRSTAKILNVILSNMVDMDFLRCQYIVGHGEATSRNDGKLMQVTMKIREQRESVAMFRNGAANLLIATRVSVFALMHTLRKVYNRRIFEGCRRRSRHTCL